MRRTWTKPELIIWLRRKARRLGCLPNPVRHESVFLVGPGPGIKIFYEKFGSLADAYRAAGLLKGGK